jgi:GTPase SAR1 family protein
VAGDSRIARELAFLLESDLLAYHVISMTSQLLPSLQHALDLLAVPATASLAIDLHVANTRLTNPAYQIAVFGAFNHGKSTLLNAILGDKALPIDLVPTTGGAIRVKYGAEITTTIVLTSGEVVSQSGTAILTEFAILDGDRRMRADIASIEVSYPHPLLKMGVELIDLPGTNDRDEQDSFVRSQILAEDLVIYVLDARTLMTLAEREHLRDWLEQRGITTIVFVTNFSNMLEPVERQELQNRLRFVAESFRSQLPSGVSNLYRVDALPALRARLKGDDSGLHASGLPMFVTALQTIFEQQQAEVPTIRQQILDPIARQVTGLLQQEIEQLTIAIDTISTKQSQEMKVKEQAKKLISSGWHHSLQELEQWLHLPTLISTCQTTLVPALRQQQFAAWEQVHIAAKLQQFQTEINDWITKMSQFFDIPSVPPISFALPEPPEVSTPAAEPGVKADSLEQLTPAALATGLGWMFAGPIGAAMVGGASILVNKVGLRDNSGSVDHQAQSLLAAYIEATEDYLCRLNLETKAILKEYRAQTTGVFEVSIVGGEPIDPVQQQKLMDLQACLANLLV